MAKKKKIELQEEITPNLIPMVDIMFLLLLFFMLGADMGQRDLEEVKLPFALTVKEDKEQVGKKNDRFTVNVYHVREGVEDCPEYLADQVCRNDKHWRIGIKGRDFTNPDNLLIALKNEADVMRAAEDPNVSERPVMVRADASAPYGQVQRVVQQCGAAGIYKIEVGAARPPDADKRGG